MPGYKRQRGPDTWRLEVTIGADYQGKPIRYSKTVHCKSAKEADRELARFYTECENGYVSRQNTTKLEAFADRWYEDYAERFLKKSSRSGAKTAIEVWIKPTIGRKKITKVSRLDVQKWINSLDDAGLSPKTIRNYYSTLRTIMAYAVDMAIIEDTPCKNIKLPKKVQHEAGYYDADQVDQLMTAVMALPPEKQKFRTAVLLILFGGLRRAELLGLNWEDIDFDTGEIHVHRNRLIDRHAQVYEDTPKTERSQRYVSMPPEIMAQLRTLKAQQAETQLRIGAKYKQSPAVFQGETGGELHPQVLQRWFVGFLKDNDLPPLGLHGLRHTHTSMLANMNIDKMQISRRLGHSQLSTTLNIYTHLFEDADQKIASDLSARYLSAK